MQDNHSHFWDGAEATARIVLGAVLVSIALMLLNVCKVMLTSILRSLF